MLRYVMGVSSFVLCLNLQLALAISALQKLSHICKKLFALKLQTQAQAQPTAASSKHANAAVCRSCILFYFTARFTATFGHQNFTVTYHMSKKLYELKL